MIMNDAVYTGSEYVQAKSKEGRDSKIFALKILVMILCGALVVEIFLYFVLIPCFTQVQIHYEGNHLYKRVDLDHLIARQKNTWFKFNTTSACAVLSSLPGIESVSIEKKFPDKIFVSITERVPIAVTLSTDDERTVAVLLDKTGAVFGPGISSVFDSLPLITGLPLEQIGQGMRLSKMYHPLLEQIEFLTSLPQKYFTAFSEIRVMPKNYGGYELIFYPVKSHVKILLDRGLNEDALKTMMVTLDVVSSIEPDVEEIDLRYGSFSYRIKEKKAEELY
jgi:cell division protein FtsQ